MRLGNLRFWRFISSKRSLSTPVSARPESETTHEQFIRDVYPEELEYIEERRRAVGQKGGLSGLAEPVEPTTEHRLVGLAFSGGGIRSATFNLGILQALQRWGLLKSVDLLSTVSGGGFIGSCLTSLLSRRRVEDEQRQGRKRPIPSYPFYGESPAVVHLRNNSNYLAPRGLLDYLRMFSVLIRGIVLNFLVLVPLLLIPCLVATFIYGTRLLNRLEYDQTVQQTIGLLSTAVTAKDVVVEEGEEVEPLLALLRGRGFLTREVADGDWEVKAALRNAKPAYRDVTKPLITSSGGENAPPVFLRRVELSDIAHRLVDAELLVPPETIEEIYLVEAEIRKGLKGERLSDFLDHLGRHIPTPARRKPGEPPKPPRLLLFRPFVTSETLVETLKDEGMVTLGDFTGTGESYKYTLTQVLLTFYEKGLFDRRQLDDYLHLAGFDRQAVYRWPRGEPAYREIEAASSKLWELLGDSPRSVAELLEKLNPPGTQQTAESSEGNAKATGEDRGDDRPGLVGQLKRVVASENPGEPAPLLVDFTNEKNRQRLIQALKKNDIVRERKSRDKGGAEEKPLGCTARNIQGCSFTDARAISRLPEVFYDEHFYLRNWFLQYFRGQAGGQRKAERGRGFPRSLWDDPPFQVRYLAQETESEDIEIEAAARELALEPGPVADVLARLKALQTPPPGKVYSLIDPALNLDDLGLPSPKSLLDALEQEVLIHCDDSEKAETCSFADGDCLDAIPRLLYDLRLFNQEWFRDYFPTKDKTDPLAYLSDEVEVSAAQRESVEKILYESRRRVVDEGRSSTIEVEVLNERIEELLKPEQRNKLRETETWNVAIRAFLDSDVLPHRVRYKQPWSIAKEKIEEARIEAESEDSRSRKARQQPVEVLPNPVSAEGPSPAAVGKSAVSRKMLSVTKGATKGITRTRKGAPRPGMTVEEFFEALRGDAVGLLPPGMELDRLFGLLLLPKQGPFNKEGLLKGRNCTNLESAADCKFATGGPDKAIRWAVEMGYLTTGEKSVSARFNSFGKRARRFHRRNLIPYLEQILWNPKQLRLPFTVFTVLAGLIWVLLFPFVNLALRHLSGGEAQRRDLFERSFSFFMLAIAGVVFLEIQPYLIYRWHYLNLGANWSLVIGAASLTSTIIVGPALSLFRKFGRMIVLAVLALLGPLLPFLIYLTVMNQIIYSERWQMRDGYDLNHVSVLIFFAAAFLILHLFLLTLDPNSTGMHGFYKDRLARAYLLAPAEGGGVVPDQDLELSKIGDDDSRAPYHLLNVALNLQASRDPSLRDRSSDFFVFSKLWVGGGHGRNTGYCSTKDMETVMPRLSEMSLGTAMAVSGAAAAPNMGSFTMGPLVVLLALLNIRLGYWIPSPRWVRRWAANPGRLGRALSFYRLRPGPYLFLREVLSRIDDRGRCVNISDGGHLENTAVFELLRRRCKFIIAADAEEDAGLNFPGLAALQRFARLDLNTEIRIDTSHIRADVTKGDERHFAVGEILYPETALLPAENGYLIYFKASLTGDESQIVSEYAARQPLFPHESTGDQFFSERQFEAYRDLGDHIVADLFFELKRENPIERAVLEWLDALGSEATSERPRKERPA